MQSAMALESWNKAWYLFFRWRCETTAAAKLGLAFGMACLTGVLAQVRIPLEWTPVPVTGQTFGVLLAGILLGTGWGAVSQAIYVSLGVAGVPWFSRFGAGMGLLAGPTGGYLVGFIAAALFVGYVFDRSPAARRMPALVVLLAVADFVFIHGLGLIQLAAWLAAANGSLPSLQSLLMAGCVPFIPGDALKIIAAAATAWAIVPRGSFR